MKNEKLFNLSEEILKIKYRVNYKINETARYNPVIEANDEFDEMPIITNEVNDQEDFPKSEGQTPLEPTNAESPNLNNSFSEKSTTVSAKTPIPAFDKNEDNTQPIDMNQIKNTDQVDDIQNDIIKHNIEAMKSIHDQLEGLNITVQGLNSKLEKLNTDVEEVREPTNVEKLMNKTNVSYPYYYNLNNFWSGNWFDQQRQKENEVGMKKMPDGTFIADFDDLPQNSKTDIQNSFNDI